MNFCLVTISVSEPEHVFGRTFETPSYKFLWLIKYKYFIRAALDAAEGNKYLHANGVVHENLKTENLLCGKVREVRRLIVDSKRSDVFSYGSALWELISGKGERPIPNTLSEGIYMNNAVCPEKLKELIQSC
ncbi:hypothetical protein YC2023_093610 [Brassica napus]